MSENGIRKFCKWFWIAGLMIGAVSGGSESNGATGLSFLKVGVDARAAGMGEAFTAVAGDAFATFWNPAGLLGAENSNVVFMHNEWLLDVNAEFGAVQFRSAKSSIAFHVYSFNVGNIEVRTIPSSEPLEETAANYLSAGVSYARQFAPHLGLGVTVKYLLEKIFVYDAAGVGVDLGFRYTALGKDLVLAGTVQNLGGMHKFREESTTLPTTLRLGTQYHLPGQIGPLDLLLAADLVKPRSEDLRFQFGAEGRALQHLLLRVGLAAGYESRDVSFGVGIHKAGFRLDYSYTPLKNDLGSGQRFSLLLEI